MFGLTDNTIMLINGVLAKYPQVKEAIIYGSRARGDYRNGSDIDLTLKGEDISNTILSKLEWDIDDLLLPYFFDISIYSKLHNPAFINSIDTEGKVFYQA